MTKHYDALTEQQQQELLEKYDPEAGSRKLTGIVAWIAMLGLLAFSLFQVYTSVFGVLTAPLQRSIHLGFALALIFLLFPARKRDRGKKHHVAWYDFILAAGSVLVGAYWPVTINELVNRVGRLTDLDFFIGLLAIVLVLEATPTHSWVTDYDHCDSFYGLCSFWSLYARKPCPSRFRT